MKEILISSSVLIIAIALLRLIFRNKVSHRLKYALWLLAALRLLIPVEFGSFQFSIHNLTQEAEILETPIVFMEEASKEPILGPSYQDIYQTVFQEYETAGFDVKTPQIQVQLEQEAAARITFPTWVELVRLIWITGMIVMGIWLLAVNYRFLRQTVRGSVVVDAPESPIPVRVSEKLHSPCLLGLFHPTIYLTPYCADDPQKRRHVLTHELTHFTHWDHIWSIVRCICLCIYWFNPLVWLAAVLSKRDCELACDEGALKNLGDTERLAYGRTLLDMVSRDISPKHLIETATAMNESKKQLTERMKFIMKKPKFYVITAICLTFAVLLVTGYAFAGTSDVIEPDDTIVSTTTTNPDDADSPETTTELKTTTMTVTPTADDSTPTSIYDFPVFEGLDVTEILVLSSGTQEELTSPSGKLYTFKAKIPYIYPFSGSAYLVNGIIERTYGEYLDDVHSARENNTPCNIYRIDYNVYLNSNILSVVTWAQIIGEQAVFTYQVFNFDMTSGDWFTDSCEQFAEMCGITEAEYADVLAASVEAAFQKAHSEEDPTGESEAYQEQLQRSIDLAIYESVDYTKLPYYIYFDRNGQPILPAHIYSLDGTTIETVLIPFAYPDSAAD